MGKLTGQIASLAITLVVISACTSISPGFRSEMCETLDVLQRVPHPNDLQGRPASTRVNVPAKISHLCAGHNTVFEQEIDLECEPLSGGTCLCETECECKVLSLICESGWSDRIGEIDGEAINGIGFNCHIPERLPVLEGCGENQR